MNIHTIKSTGSGTFLGPVKLIKVWGYKPGDKSINGNFQDATGESAFKIWGALPGLGLEEGKQIKLTGVGPKGAITYKEYPPASGKWALNCSDCRVEVFNADGSPSVAAAYTPPEQAPYQAPAGMTLYQAPAGMTLDQKLEATARQAARWTAIYIENLVVNHGFSKDEAIMIAQGAHSGFALWWFGEKGI